MSKRGWYCVLAIVLALLLITATIVGCQRGIETDAQGMTHLSGLAVSGGLTDELVVNQTSTGDIAEFRDNGTTVLRILDGGVTDFLSNAPVNLGAAGTDFTSAGLTTARITATAHIEADGTLNVDGAATLNSTLDVDGAISSGTGAITLTDASGVVVTQGGLAVSAGGAGITGGLSADYITSTNSVVADSAVVGGGYGDTGCTLSNAGAVQCNGAGTFGGAMTFSGGLDMGNSVISNIGNAGTDFDTNGGLTTASTVTVTAGGLVLPDGAAGTPAWRFGSDPDGGAYYIGANNWGLAVGGALRLEFTASGLNLTGGQFNVPDGTAAAPIVRFTDDIDTGLYRVGDNVLGVTAAGANVLSVGPTSITATIGAGDRFQVNTGNLVVGAGTPGIALNGGDAYVTGYFEVDGNAYFDSAVEINNDITLENDESISNSYNGVITFTTTTAAFTGGLDVNAASDFAGNITMNGYNLIGPQLAMTFVGDGTRVLTNEESGSWWSDLGATVEVTFTLPLSGEGAWYCIYNMTGVTITIDPGQPASMIRRLTNCAGTRERIQSTAADDMICLFGANTDTQWFPWAVYGMWADID